MPRGKLGRKSQKPEVHASGSEDEDTLASELADQGEENTQSMASLEKILCELRDFRRENSVTLKEIKEDIRVANNRIDNAEGRILEAEKRLQCVEDATLELLELQKRFENRLVDQEGRSRRENVRIHGVKEGAEDNAKSMIDFIQNLLREKLEPSPSLNLQIERAHRALVTRPPPGDSRVLEAKKR